VNGPTPIIFIVDDDLRVREALSSLIKSLGLRAATFGSATAFLEAEKPDAPACLVLDLQLPDMTGLELQAMLNDRPTPPIVFITGHGDVPSSVRAMKAGAVDFLSKPFGEGELLRAIEAGLALDRDARARRSELGELQKNYAHLTPREREVFPFVVTGAPNKQTAKDLGTSEATIGVHRHQIMRKMAAQSFAELVRMADKLASSEQRSVADDPAQPLREKPGACSTESVAGDSGEATAQSGIAAFGPFRLFAAARRLERNGNPVEIGGRALDVLVELVKNPGRVITKAELLSAIWSDTTVVEGVLRTHIYQLRKALGDGMGGARYVTSVAGRGYCFVAPVVRDKVQAPPLPSSGFSTLLSNLPPRLARMAGRDDVVRILAAQLLERRFITIVGAAGIGKTTVAVAVAHTLLDEFQGATRFVDLGELIDPTLVAPTIASSLGVPIQGDDAIDRLQVFLEDKKVLLVLDNCEHVVASVARLVERLVSHAPRLHVLATSREALRVEGEHAHRLEPLETPDEGSKLDAETVQTYAAVQVFLERAAASGWSGELTDEDAVIVAEACRRLDGVALAIELAASFVGQCGLHGMAAVLEDRLGLLWQQGRRTAPARQQTLHALVTWSYERLSEYERVVLRRLGVFVGAFSLDAAKAVLLEPGETVEALLDAMNELAAKSLLSIAVDDGEVVYRLLETTRLYALDRLAESGELDGTSLRHARVLTEDPDRLDLGNVRAALRWSFSSPGGYAVGVRLVQVAARMFLELGLMIECQRWCRQALDVVDATDTGALVEIGLLEALAIATMASRGNAEDVRRTLMRALDRARTLAAVDDEVRLLGHLNSFLVRRGEFKEALEVAERSSSPARTATPPSQVRAQWMLAFSHHFRGDQAAAERYSEAAQLLETASTGLPAAVTRRAQGFYTLSHVSALVRTQWLRGHADRALATARDIVRGLAALRTPFERSSALLTCEAIFIWCGEWAEAESLIDTLSELVERYSLGSQRGAAMAVRGELLVRTGRAQEGCTLLQTAAEMQKIEQNASFASVYAAALAEGLAANGAFDEALRTITEAIADAERRGAGFNLPELHRLQGVLMISCNPTNRRAGDDAFSAAIELAKQQSALAWELRATTSRTRERLKRGASGEALSELAAIYTRFSEGMQTPDLCVARDLLEGRANR
jgi:predicted ATPase/FixJ family two-component response regulator/DNA-binding winged helix-turn-helix (wHTH) protein